MNASLSTQSIHKNHTVNNFYLPTVIVMVGLPARGKTLIARRTSRYLNWVGIRCRVYYLSHYERGQTAEYRSPSFYKLDNATSETLRTQTLMEALAEIEKWLKLYGAVVILDGTNPTRERRALIRRLVVDKMGYQLLFIESICNDQKIIDHNFNEVLIFGADYDHDDSTDEQIRKHLEARLKMAEREYEPIDQTKEKTISFIKYFDNGASVFAHNASGLIGRKIVNYLLSLRITAKTLYFARHGESVFNKEGRIGGDPPLTRNGETFARALGDFVNDLKNPKLQVWTSSLQRSIDTAAHILNHQKKKFHELNELKCGLFDGMTYEAVRKQYPEEDDERADDKFNYRYPKGENYPDIIHRIDPVLMDLEHGENTVLVITHQATLRCFLGYFQDVPNDEIPYMDLPLHTVFRIGIHAWGCEFEQIKLPVDAVGSFVSSIKILDKKTKPIGK